MRLGDVLVNSGVLTNTQLASALEEQKGSGKKLGEFLVDRGIVNEDSIAQALSQQMGLELVRPQDYSLTDEMKALWEDNASLLKKYVVFPIEEPMPGLLRLAMSDPMDMYAMDDISIVSNCRVEAVVSTTRDIMLAIEKYFGSNDLDEALEEYANERLPEEEDLRAEDINSSPIVMLVTDMINSAVRQRASDIHIEPLEKKVRVRYRIDGALYNKKTYPKGTLAAIVARIKIIGGMDIAEKRKPQDGRITQVVDRMEYDIRVSVLPTVYGEKVVMRLTSKTGLTKEKSQLGLKPDEMVMFDRILRHPHGILLVTGPTGSGKSTTLYTALSELNTEFVNIITVEDPVEANIDGINQVQTNVKAELTFASALRSILRQDPDIIMIGEIRDQETAEIAVQASITGHLVVSTLHTNSAVSTITRLEDMGIESYLIADSVIGVIAQRLVRRLCPNCKQADQATAEELDFLGLPADAQQIVYRPKGCPQCDNTGFRGRIGVYEIMEINTDVKRAIAKRAGVEKIKEEALKGGMHTLRMSASAYVLDGTTSYEEAVRISFDL
ncbi:MAG: Flp pilus assembly complex ATPase component TadA [Lachnospiraceae bacterium]|nr:Flp pilus assembly complex ATPase component TadA [Lachnospiraceae bacterium]